MTTSSWNCRQDKTLITHARTGAARFLGYEITVQHNDQQDHPRPPRRSTAQIALRVPTGRDQGQVRPLPASAANPRTRDPLINDDDYTIVATYGAEYRGIVQYYLLAGDVYRLHRLRWVMETSMLKTLAGKHRSTVSKMAAKHKAKIDDTARAAHVLRSHASNATAGSHWSHGSAASRSNGRRRRSSPTASRPGRPTRTRS